MPQQPLTVVKSEPLSVVSSEPLETTAQKPSGGIMQGAADLLSGLWEKQPIHPIDAANALADIKHYPAMVSQMLQAQGVPFDNAVAAYKKGDYAQAATSLVNWLLPIIGPQNESAQQRYMKGEISGPRFVGEELGISGQVAAPGAMKNLGSARVPAVAANPNPVQAEAVAFGQARGIPVDAATATGNRAVSAVQNVADRSLGGWMAGSGNAAQEQANALTRVGSDLAAQAHPSPVTPMQAGEAVRQSITDTITGLHGQANKAYDAVRAAEAKAPIPIDVTNVKAALQPVYDSLKRQLPITQAQASPGLKAIENVLNGPDSVPLSQAEADLGAIKAVSRGAEMPELRGIGRGLAAKAVAQLDDAVTKAADHAGVLKDLQAGRAATASKYQAAEVLSQLRDEPVRVFQQTTYAKDAGIDQLQQIAKLAPNDLPKIGRAFLDDLMGQATAEGGFDKARTLATKWANLGPQTKALLFKDPAYIADLDKFFALAKKIGESPNPSGTAHTVLTAGQTALIFTNPMTGMASTLGTGVLSKFLHSRAGVNLLTRGFQVPLGNSAAATAVFGDLTRALESPVDFVMRPIPAHAQKSGGGPQ